MASRIIAITPTGPITNPNFAAHVQQALERWAFNGVRDMRKYPPARPWKGRTPQSGPRKGGRRTGTLGRNWTVGRSRGATMSIAVVNPVSYSPYVQGHRRGRKGERQTANMADRGWQSIDDAMRPHTVRLRKDVRAAMSVRRIG